MPYEVIFQKINLLPVSCLEKLGDYLDTLATQAKGQKQIGHNTIQKQKAFQKLLKYAGCIPCGKDFKELCAEQAFKKYESI